jgi:hypothetical protein
MNDFYIDYGIAAAVDDLRRHAQRTSSLQVCSKPSAPKFRAELPPDQPKTGVISIRAQ